MHSKNEVELSFDARSVNEGFARMAVAAFITELIPTMDQLSDVKTAVSEAVTNAIIHGYDNPEEKVHMTCRIMGREVEIIVCDTGRGLRMWRRQWNRSTPQSRNWSAPGWDLRSWKRLWMKFMFSLRPEKEPACA